MIDEQSRGLSKLVKPAKIYMNNTNLIYAYGDDCKAGMIEIGRASCRERV